MKIMEWRGRRMSDNVVVAEGHNHADFGPVTTYTRVSDGQIAEARIDNINVPLACYIALAKSFSQASGNFETVERAPGICPESITNFFNHFRESGYAVTQDNRDGLVATRPENPAAGQSGVTMPDFLKNGM